MGIMGACYPSCANVRKWKNRRKLGVSFGTPPPANGQPVGSWRGQDGTGACERSCYYAQLTAANGTVVLQLHLVTYWSQIPLTTERQAGIMGSSDGGMGCPEIGGSRSWHGKMQRLSKLTMRQRGYSPSAALGTSARTSSRGMRSRQPFGSNPASRACCTGLATRLHSPRAQRQRKNSRRSGES